MKKGIFLSCIILLLISGWSAAWFYVANRVEAEIAKAKDRFETTGGIAQCTNQTTFGYPFRISINCDRLAIQRSGNGFSSSGLKSAAHLYQPNKVLLEFSSPGEFLQPGGLTHNLQWSSMRANLKAGFQKLNAVSFQTTDLIATPNTGDQPMNIVDLQYHERLEGDNNLDMAIAIIGAKDILFGPLGKFDFDLRSEIKLQDVHSNFSRDRSFKALIKTRDVNATIQRIHMVMADGGSIKLSGPVSFSTQGTITAKFNVELNDLDSLTKLAIDKSPHQKRHIQQAVQAIKLLSKPDANGTYKFNFTLQDNVLKLGLIPLGRLPKLY